jgi:hypothetical protein
VRPLLRWSAVILVSVGAFVGTFQVWFGRWPRSAGAWTAVGLGGALLAGAGLAHLRAAARDPSHEVPRRQQLEQWPRGLVVVAVVSTGSHWQAGRLVLGEEVLQFVGKSQDAGWTLGRSAVVVGAARRPSARERLSVRFGMVIVPLHQPVARLLGVFPAAAAEIADWARNSERFPGG